MASSTLSTLVSESFETTTRPLRPLLGFRSLSGCDLGQYRTIRSTHAAKMINNATDTPTASPILDRSLRSCPEGFVDGEGEAETSVAVVLEVTEFVEVPSKTMTLPMELTTELKVRPVDNVAKLSVPVLKVLEMEGL